MGFLRLVIWLIIGFIVAKIFGSFFTIFRSLLTPKGTSAGVEEKRSPRQFQNIEDAEFEDITEKNK